VRAHEPALPPSTTCVIAGCGPAGAMLGLLLARAGVGVVVLEKHPDFFRDFRGDTVHASTLQVLDELGLIEAFDRLPQQRTTQIHLMTDDGSTPMGDFTELPGKFRYMSMVPQWDFLSFLTEEAARYPGFALHREVEVVGLVEDDGGMVRGVRCRTAAGEQVVHADLVVAADGRQSATRAAAGLVATEYGSPLDVLWYRVPREAGDPSGTFLRAAPGALLPMIDRRTYWQGAYTVAKGGFAELRARDIEAFRSTLRACLPFLGDRVDDVTWDGVGFLEVRVNRLASWWRPGLLCIGDAAHAMSPIGGVGINLAIQDAVAAANILAGRLLDRRVRPADLRAVQRRRELPTRVTQRLQLGMQRAMIGSLRADRARIPLPMKWASRFSPVRRIVSRFLALGVRNESVRTGRAASWTPGSLRTGPNPWP
jgi:2-polyprenyl-6-methoxyphenol hydroxylase-like FAD-dependent oxidoreductase